MDIIDFGVAPYRQIWSMQHELHDELKKIKSIAPDKEKELILIGEHTDVYTLGFHGKEENLLRSRARLEEEGTEIIRIERGGDITYHGPGQVIVYPIIDLEKHGLGVKSYVNLLEEAVIRLLALYGLKGERIPGATGIWFGAGTGNERKICAIGVKISRYVTMHGIGLNVNTDLTKFQAINPCGFTDKGVTSLASELCRLQDIEEVKKRLLDIFLDLLT